MPSTYPISPIFSKSDNCNCIELTKSVKFMASLHVSFKKNCKLNVLLLLPIVL